MVPQDARPAKNRIGVACMGSEYPSSPDESSLSHTKNAYDHRVESGTRWATRYGLVGVSNSSSRNKKRSYSSVIR